ncbi:MAG: hypothetical protein ABFE01_25965 [Phycisphaerales bacterium]
MDKLSIKLADDKTVFGPRDTIRGVIEWNLDSNPRRLDLSLFWYTAGRGTRDVGMVHNAWFDDPGMHGSKEFSFALPDGPLSVSGKLVSIIWAIELTCSPGSETTRREITLSLTGKKILLDSVTSRNPFSHGGDASRPDSPESILRAGS